MEIVRLPPRTEPGGDEGGGAGQNLPQAAADRSDKLAPDASPAWGALLTGLRPPDLAAIERGVDELFAGIDHLGETLTDARTWQHLAPWVTSAAAALGAFEIARRRWRRPAPLELPVAAGGPRGEPIPLP
jgi:hypothetical protein